MTVFNKMAAGVLAVGVMLPSLAFAETSSSSITALLEQIKALNAQILALKQQQTTLQGQIKTAKESVNAQVKELRSQIKCGASGEDVALLQTILASDSSIFPEGVINGFYGKKTSEAVKRFQRMTGLTPTGCVGPQTLNALNNFLKKHPIIVQDGTVCALVLNNGEKPRGWDRKLDREHDKHGMSDIPACTGGIPQSILNLFGIGSTTPYVPPTNNDQKAKVNVNVVVSGGTANPANFVITVNGANPNIAWFLGSSNSREVKIAANTAYSVTASSVANYTSSMSAGCSSSGLSNGSEVNCTITETYNAAADTTAPTVSAVSSTNITVTGATVTWTTNENATSQVEYGTTASYGSTTTLNTTLVANHSVAITGLANATLYHFRVISKDAAGNSVTSGDMTFTTGTVDTTAPTLSSINSGALTTTGATVTWTTNEGATSQVEYGTTVSYGSTTSLDASLVTSHTVALTGLTAGTTYHYRVISKDSSNNVVTSGDQTFVTTALDTTAPVISGTSVSPIAATTASILWTTNEAATGKIYYGTVSPLNLGTALSVSNAALVTSHTLGLTGLTASSTYYYVIESKDALNNTATSSEMSFNTTN